MDRWQAGIVVLALLLPGCLTAEAPAPQVSLTSQSPSAPGQAGVAHRSPTLAPPETEEAETGGLPPGVMPVRGVSRLLDVPTHEPTIGVDAKGRIFVATWDAGTTTSRLVVRSDDGGVTWKDVTPRLGPFTPTLGTGDPYVYVDPFSGRLFHSLLLGFQCTTISFSDDAGESWVTNPLGCGLPPSVPLHDHQTIFSGKHRTLPPVGYPAVVYYCVNRVVDTACATSLNGGVTFGPLRPAIYLGLDPSAGVPGNQSATLDGICSGLTAHGVAAPDGTVYLARGWCGLPLVAVSRDDGLTWETTLVSPTLRMDRLDHDLNIAVDEAGNAYAFFRGEDGQAYLSVSTDGGRTWREPLNVTPPGVTAVDFPTAAAGAEGRLALAFYGTTEEAHYSGFSDEATWNVYLTVTTDGLAANPLFTTVSMNDPANPVVRGACAKHDGCHGVGDFIDSVIDAEGRPWVAFVDVCEGACAEPTGKENTARGEGEGIGVVGTLAEGPRLRGVMGPLPP